MEDNIRGLQRDKQRYGGKNDHMNLQDVVVDTPPSNYNFNDSDNTLNDSIKMQNNEEIDYEYQKKL